MIYIDENSSEPEEESHAIALNTQDMELARSNEVNMPELKESIIICGHCSTGFGSNDSFNDHRNSCYKEDSTIKHTCRLCLIDFMNIQELRKHVGSVRIVTVYKCKECTVSFSDINGLTQHMTIEHIKIQKCRLCDNEYQRIDELLKHI